MPGTSAGEAKPAAKLSKKERARLAKARKRRDREAGSDDEDLGAPLASRPTTHDKSFNRRARNRPGPGTAFCNAGV